MKNLLYLFFILAIIKAAPAQVPDSTLRELPDQRTYFSKTYYNAKDNTYTAVVSAGYIHYLAADDKYQDIDTHLRPDTSGAYYIIDNGLYNAAFTGDVGKGNWDVAYEVPKPVRQKFHDPGKPRSPTTRIRWKVLSYGYFDRQSNRYVILENANAATPVVSGNTINYPQVFKDISIRYLCGNTRIKEEIVLSQRARNNLPDPAQHGLSRNNSYFVVAMEFLLTPNNINVFARRQGTKTRIKQGNNFSFDGDDPIEFEDESETLHFFFPKDYAWALADSVTEFVNRISLQRYFYSDRGKHYMLIGVPWNWIQTAAAGDLVIDPTTTVTANEDVKLQDDTGNYGSDVMLAAGKNTGSTRRRSLVKFNLSGIPSNAVVLNAQLRLYQQDAFSNNDTTDWVNRWVQAHQLLVDWNEMQATRDNRLTGTPWKASFVKIGAGSDPATTDANGQFESTTLFQQNEWPVWKTWNLTNLTQKWINGTTTNYGVILWATNETVDGYIVRFWSSEYSNSALHPKLEVIYSTESATRTVYFLKDHLGSIRATVLDSVGAPVIGYDDYDPWGYPLVQRTKAIPNAYLQGASKNKFTGKERDDEFGLNLDYFGARYYDPQIGRWMVRDPLAEKYSSLSPYVFVADNPLKFFDPDGKKIIIAGTPRFRQVALANLQRLSNDKVSIRKDGTVIITKLNSENLDNALRKGTNLIRQLNQKDSGAKAVTIIETKGKNMTRTAGLDAYMIGGQKGSGQDSEVRFNPSKIEGGVDVTGSTNRPTEIGLGHELIHAEHNAAGEHDLSTANVTDPDTGFKGVLEKDEVRTRREENELRKEQGLKPRKEPK